MNAPVLSTVALCEIESEIARILFATRAMLAVFATELVMVRAKPIDRETVALEATELVIARVRLASRAILALWLIVLAAARPNVPILLTDTPTPTEALIARPSDNNRAITLECETELTTLRVRLETCVRMALCATVLATVRLKPTNLDTDTPTPTEALTVRPRTVDRATVTA